ncbi:MAG: cellulase family glycosylhydrolase [Deltaproteobacteria bacterium]|nr:cellulase family glycosylhydrolase [Deltaproteobacteria bacterium]
MHVSHLALPLCTLLAALPTACNDGSSAPLSPPELPTLRVTVDGLRLRDALGREVLLRGVNAGGRSKFDPFFPFPFAESGRADQAGEPPFAEALETYTARVATWGLDVVRLTFSWEGLEPTRGEWDSEYLDRYAAMAESFGRRGVRVIVDFHQDAFASPLCGDGFPLWALPDPAMTPRTDCSRWFQGYLGDAEVDAVYDRFWANGGGLRDDFEAMWRRVAERLWPVEGVIGFDVMNEPHYGTADVDEWSPAVLRPFFERMATVLREVAPGALIFFEPSGVDAADHVTTLEPPAGGAMVFAPHYYAAAVFLLGPDAATYDTDADLAPWATWAATYGVPLLLGEFGSVTGTDGGRRYLAANFASLDHYLFHGTVWDYSTAHDLWNEEAFSVTGWGGEETPSVEALVRAYPRAVAGRIESFVWDAETRHGMLVIAAAPGVTELAAPVRLFPEGATATLAGVPGRWAWDRARGLLLVETTAAGSATIEFGPVE